MKQRFLVKCVRSGRFYFRISVPKALRSKYQQREIRRALGTTDFLTAQRVALELAEKCHVRFRSEMNDTIFPFNQFIIKKEFDENGRVISETAQTEDDKDPQLEKEALALYLNSNSQKSSILLSSAIEEYCQEKIRKNKWREKTAAGNLAEFKKILKIIEDKPLSSYQRSDASNLINILEKKKLSPRTINRYLGSVSSVYKWIIETKNPNLLNPFVGWQIELEKDDEQKAAYSLADLQSLFENFPIDKNRPSRYWIPHLMLFSGARPGELAQFKSSNIVTVENLPCIHISKEIRTKTKNSRRLFPIHSELLNLGFLDYVETIKKDARLFPELNPKRSSPAGAVSSWWNDTHQKKKNLIEEKKSLYSIKHSVITQFRNFGVPESICAEIVGHRKGNTESYLRYASSGELEPLRNAIESISWNIKFSPWSI